MTRRILYALLALVYGLVLGGLANAEWRLLAATYTTVMYSCSTSSQSVPYSSHAYSNKLTNSITNTKSIIANVIGHTVA